MNQVHEFLKEKYDVSINLNNMKESKNITHKSMKNINNDNESSKIENTRKIYASALKKKTDDESNKFKKKWMLQIVKNTIIVGVQKKAQALKKMSLSEHEQW